MDKSFSDIIDLAIQREEEAYDFYMDIYHQFYTKLANLHVDGETKTMLLKMANEELKHKEKMEYLYANTAFPQTSGG